MNVEERDRIGSHVLEAIGAGIRTAAGILVAVAAKSGKGALELYKPVDAALQRFRRQGKIVYQKRENFSRACWFIVGQ